MLETERTVAPEESSQSDVKDKRGWQDTLQTVTAFCVVIAILFGIFSAYVAFMVFCWRVILGG